MRACVCNQFLFKMSKKCGPCWRAEDKSVIPISLKKQPIKWQSPDISCSTAISSIT